MLQVIFVRHNIEANLFAPEIGAIPVQLALMMLKAHEQFAQALLARQAVVIGKECGQVLHPKDIVEVQVEHGAIHV